MTYHGSKSMSQKRSKKLYSYLKNSQNIPKQELAIQNG